MSDTPLELLLGESRSLYKAEADRYGSLYGRIGVLMAVYAIYANALVWFFQKGTGPGTANALFVAGLVVLSTATVAGFGSVMFALSWGEKFTAILGPRFWCLRRDEVRQPAFLALLVDGMPPPTEEQVEQRVAILLKEDLVDDFTRCAERNMNLNERRFAFIHRANQFAGAGFVALLFLVGVHVYSVWRDPPQAGAARAQGTGTTGAPPVSGP